MRSMTIRPALWLSHRMTINTKEEIKTKKLKKKVITGDWTNFSLSHFVPVVSFWFLSKNLRYYIM